MADINLQKELEKILKDYPEEVQGKADRAAKNAADKTVQMLKATSPRREKGHKGRRYANAWGVEMRPNKSGRGTEYVVRNKQYQLTHLLEKGHNIFRKGKRIGRAPAKVHIAPAESYGISEFISEVEREL